MAAKKRSKTAKKKKTARKTSHFTLQTMAIGGAFDVIAGRKPDPDGPWRPGTGWGESTGPNPFSQWLKARKPRPS